MKYGHTQSRANQNVRTSSKAAHFTHMVTGNLGRETNYTFQILKKANKPCTRRMLSELTNYPVNKITEYVKRLLQAEKIIELEIKKPCEVSGVKAFYLIINTEKIKTK